MNRLSRTTHVIARRIAARGGWRERAPSGADRAHLWGAASTPAAAAPVPGRGFFRSCTAARWGLGLLVGLSLLIPRGAAQQVPGPAAGGAETNAVGTGSSEAELAALKQKADALFKAERYSEALPLYRRLARSGDLFSQCRLGEMLIEGLGVRRDARKAFQYYLKAARAGAPVAQCMVGVLYYEGTGTLRDYKTAAHWYMKAALQGNDMAMFNLALMYRSGRGVRKDPAQFLKWLQKAAALGNPRALLELGNLHHDGIFVPKDVHKAVELYAKAAKAGDPAALLALGLAYCTGDGVRRDLTKAKRCVKLAFDNPDTDAAFRKKCEAVWNKYRLYNY